MKKALDALLVAIGGALGSLARYGVTRLALWLAPGLAKAANWPGTLAVNVLGTFLIAFLTFGLKEARPTDAAWIMPLLVLGFCGGFTTFSTFALDGYKLWTGGEAVTAILNILLSLLLSLGALFLGFKAAALIFR